MEFENLNSEEQLAKWEGRALDERPALPTGFPAIDQLLFRGGFQPGTFVILGGRTHTRKTGVALNMAATMLRNGVPVGFVGLDEPVPAYVAKLCSVLSGDQEDGRGGYGAEWLEEHWGEQESRKSRLAYRALTGKFNLTSGYRPTLLTLNKWVEACHERPRVVFIDYMSVLAREKYAGNDTSRIPKLAEDLKVWANEAQLVVIAIHQVGRESKATGKYYHGDTPMQLESLKYGGEEMADVVLGTYRPTNNPLGSMSYDDASTDFDDEFNEEKWLHAKRRVERFKDSTMMQVLKNRPSQKGLLLRGIELVAPGASMYQRQVRPADLEQHSEYEEEMNRASSQ